MFLNADCMNPETGPPSYPDNYFDLAVVDPPYGISYSTIAWKDSGRKPRGNAAKKGQYAEKNWDNDSPDKSYFNELFRVSKNQIIWGANHFISKMPIDSRCWIIWNKQNGTTQFSDAELAWTSFKSPIRIANFTWNGMLQADMKNKEHRIHPTQKPVKLYQWLLENYATEGNLILDTHVGSASSLIACESMGFKYVGFELDADYYEAAKKRMQSIQVRMF